MLVAWLGGVAFVTSLAYLVYFYVVTLASSAGNVEDRAAHTAINLALFSTFALHHSLFARAATKRSVTRVVPPRFERSFYVWVASALTVLMCVLWKPVAGTAYIVDGWWRVPLWMVQATGALVVVRAARVVRPLELAGIDQAIGRRAADSVKIVGPFRVVRHPIYLGWVLMVFATPAMTANRLVFAVISSLYLILAIPWEERSLVAGHGDRYRAYQRAVRWRLVPGIW